MKLLTFLMISTLSFSALADCVQTYELKARERRSENRMIRAGGTIMGTAAAVVFVPPLLIGGSVGLNIGFGALMVAPVAGSLAQDAMKKNKFFSGYSNFDLMLEVLADARNNQVHPKLLEKLNKKISIDSLSSQDQFEMKEKIVFAINELNDSQKICWIYENDKMKSVLTYKQFTKLLIQELQK